MQSLFPFARARSRARSVCIAAGAVFALAAQAQTSSSSTTASAAGGSWIPYTQSGYIGLSAGRSDFGGSCGAIALRCDDRDTMGKLTLGGYFSPYFGAELAYADMGSADRAGGSADARALQFNLIGRAPLSEQFSLIGKLGANYGRTRVSALPGTGITTGRDSGWGPTVGVGLQWNFTRQWSAVLEWERARYHFAGGRENVDATSIGLRYHF